MSAESDKIRNAFADQLLSFDEKLEATSNDVFMLADIQDGISALLASGGDSEAAIRGVLQERYEAGELRKETFQLIKSMLDGYVTEKVPTGPVPAAKATEREEPAVSEVPATHVATQVLSESVADDAFGATTVIPNEALPFNKIARQVQVGSVLRDRFLLQEEISGGMGTVYKALDRRLAEAGSGQPSVAIKVLSPQLAEDGHALRALQQEAAKTRCLVHPHIVRFIDLDRDDELYFLILEWLEGRTLADILDSADARSIDVEAAFRILHQVGDALDYAHRCGIVHADIKPGNIMLMPNGDAKLFDFGVARVRQRQMENEFDPGVLGALTPAYSSMQVLGGEEPAASDDVFSLACLLYRLLAGYRVFGPRNAAEASQEGMTPQRPQNVTDGQWKVLKKALSYSRVTRYGSVKAFLEALDEERVEDVEETLNIEAPERFAVNDDGGSPGKWLATVVVVLGLAGIGAQQMGYLDPWLAQLQGTTGIVDVAGPPPEDELIIEEVATEPELEIAPTVVDEPVTEPVEQSAEEVADEVVPEATAEAEDKPEPTEPNLNLVDFSTLPPPTTIVNFSLDGPVVDATYVTLREDDDPVLVDFIRDGDVSAPLTLRLEEVGFSGNRSPWSSGQYAFSNGGLLVFPRGQARARVTLTTASDPRREPDQQSTLRLRLADSAESELAVVNVTIEDDDQREFEGRMPSNTIAFTSSQVSASEADPAVQIDVIRFNPDNTTVVVNYSVEDISATEGEDYFAPGTYSISFGPGQRSARLLIPLVQDSVAEGDEAFAVKLVVDLESRPANLSPNIAVMIRDDEV